MSLLSIFSNRKPRPFSRGAGGDPALAWLETTNPLRGMTASAMQNLFDASRAGNTVRLQWLYNEIERTDPTLLICQQRRTGALAALDWHVSTRSEKRTRSFDQTLADEQAAVLEAAFGEAEQANFNDAAEHLARAFFRGFAHVLPRWSDDGLSLRGFDLLDNWNFLRNPETGRWHWNPEARENGDFAACPEIPPGELLSFVTPFHIDYPAMAIYLRAAVGEKGWAKFVERFGIPPVILTMPGDIPSDQVEAWREAAEKVAQGGCGAVPNGTTVSFCDGARGINPFRDFIHNQRELIVLMATGGLLTSLTEAGSGTLAGSAHADTWSEVRRADAAKIGCAINRALADAILDRAFPGRRHLAYFSFDTEATPTPSEVFDDAAKARAAGYLVDQTELEAKTGYKLVREEISGGAGAFSNRLSNRPSADGRAALGQISGGEGVAPSYRGAGASSPASRILARIAATILDGSIPFEEALKRAETELAEIDPALLAADLEKQLEQAMFAAAAEATNRLPNSSLSERAASAAPSSRGAGASSPARVAPPAVTQADAEKLYEEMMSK